MAAEGRGSLRLATAFLCTAWALGAGLPAADLPRSVELERLGDNGRSFVSPEARVPLRCLDLAAILQLPADEQVQALDRAASAGFNAVSFEAPLYGPQGLAKALGKVDAGQAEALSRLLQACRHRRLYAFPVLWTPAAADALIGTASARTAFWGGKNSLGWQAWSLHELAKLRVDGQPLTASAAVGGWLLYRGPWPGGAPLHGAAPEAMTPSGEAWLRSWASWQVKLLRKAGFTQRLGLGLWAKKDLPLSTEIPPQAPVVKVDGPQPASPVAEPAPYAPLSDTSVTAEASQEQAKALDALPPVPGISLGDGDSDADQAPAPDAAAAQTPWDLEGLDWDRIEDFFAGAPLSTQVDFLEFSLETEDWYRVGDRLAQAAAKAEVPVLWRQDWRTASRYERLKRLEAPAPLAGLEGPWPDDDWPSDGEALWPPAEGAAQAPFAIRKLALKRQGRKLLLAVELNKPASLIVRWGKAWPLNQEVRSSGRAKTEISLPLVGALPGQWLLLQVKADTQRAGGAVARTRWMKAPQ
jgi:hypothetical protein